MNDQAERSVFLCTCPLSQLKLSERAIHSVLPAQLKEGTEVYAINEFRPRTRSYAGQYRSDTCPCTHSYSVSISYICTSKYSSVHALSLVFASGVLGLCQTSKHTYNCTYTDFICFKKTIVRRLQQEEAEKGVKKLKDEIRSIVDTKMPAILTDLSALQDTHVLSGNYRLKLARQRYFLDKQTEVRL